MKKLMELLGDRREIRRFLQDHKEGLKKAGILVLVIVLGLVISVVRSGGQEEAEAQEAATVTEETSAEVIYVDVGGEVNQPSVVELSDGSRVTDAIAAAGGLTDKADLTDINRAAFVSDGEKIYIPSQVQEDDSGILSGEGGNRDGIANRSSDGKININTADSAQLQELNGVGPATAEKIIDYRKQNGRFRSIEDLKNVSGIGDKTYEKLKDHIKT